MIKHIMLSYLMPHQENKIRFYRSKHVTVTYTLLKLHKLTLYFQGSIFSIPFIYLEENAEYCIEILQYKFINLVG